MITRINESLIQIKSGITINVDGSVKIHKPIVFPKNIIFGTPLHVVMKMENI